MSGMSRNLIAQFGMNQDRQSRLYVPSGGGSFFSAPFVLTDQSITYTGVALDAGFRFMTDGGLDEFGGGDIQFRTAYHQDYPTPTGIANYSVRYTEILESNVSSFVFDFPAVDAWRILSTTRAFDMNRPAAATTEYFKLRIQLAANADLTDILCQADIRFEWQRP